MEENGIQNVNFAVKRITWDKFSVNLAVK